MDQPTFADLEYEHRKRKTRREVFLEKMNAVIPWGRLEERIRPVYPQAGKGRRPYPLAVMLRVHVVQVCYNLSDPGMEDLLYEAASVRRFVGLSVSEPAPDESTILHFRHLLERHGLGEELFKEINAHLEARGLRLREGTIVDATIIAAPSSTKNRTRERDPEMRQVKKGSQYYFGMKLHVGVDAETGLVHSFETTPAGVHDVTQAGRLLHGGETRVWGDAGYVGVQKREENRDLAVQWRVALKPGLRRKLGPESRGGCGGKGKGVGAGQGGASLPEGKEHVRLRQGALPGLGQEQGAVGPVAGAGEFTDGPEPPGPVTQGVVCPTPGLTPKKG